jgi:hypothetical protein
MRKTVSEYTAAGSAKPGSLHGHLSLPPPLKTVQDANAAVEHVSKFHHHGATQHQQGEWSACFQETAGRGPCPPWDKFGKPASPPRTGSPLRVPSHEPAPFEARQPTRAPATAGTGAAPRIAMHALQCAGGPGPGCYKDERGDLIYCPAGSYCPVGSLRPVGCPANTASPLGSGNVTDCQASARCPPHTANVAR